MDFAGTKGQVNAPLSITVSFLYKIIDLPEGQINDPHRGNTIFCSSSQQHPRLASCVASGTRTPTLGAEVLGHSQQQLTQTLIVHLLIMHFFTPILDCEKSTE